MWIRDFFHFSHQQMMLSVLDPISQCCHLYMILTLWQKSFFRRNQKECIFNLNNFFWFLFCILFLKLCAILSRTGNSSTDLSKNFLFVAVCSLYDALTIKRKLKSAGIFLSLSLSCTHRHKPRTLALVLKSKEHVPGSRFPFSLHLNSKILCSCL